MKKFLIFSILCSLTLAFAGKMTVVLPVKATAMEQTAARELQDLLKKTSVVSIVKEGEKTSGKVLYVGATGQAEKLFGKKTFGDEEWVLRAIDSNSIVLAGGRRGVI